MPHDSPSPLEILSSLTLQLLSPQCPDTHLELAGVWRVCVRVCVYMREGWEERERLCAVHLPLSLLPILHTGCFSRSFPHCAHQPMNIDVCWSWFLTLLPTHQTNPATYGFILRIIWDIPLSPGHRPQKISSSAQTPGEPDD